jgi:hypothetical protein
LRRFSPVRRMRKTTGERIIRRARYPRWRVKRRPIAAAVSCACTQRVYVDAHVHVDVEVHVDARRARARSLAPSRTPRFR